jgi:hypothetical protein
LVGGVDRSQGVDSSGRGAGEGLKNEGGDDPEYLGPGSKIACDEGYYPIWWTLYS